MQDYWAEAGPPVSVSVAAYLGLIKKGSSGSSSGGPSQMGDLDDLIDMFPGGMIQ